MRDIGRWCLFTTHALDVSASGKLTCVSCRVSSVWVGGGDNMAQTFPCASRDKTVLYIH